VQRCQRPEGQEHRQAPRQERPVAASRGEHPLHLTHRPASASSPHFEAAGRSGDRSPIRPRVPGPRSLRLYPMDLLAGRWRPRLLFGALYFAEGAPIGYLWIALATRMRVADVPPDAIGRYLALLALPRAFELLCAPAAPAPRRAR